MGNATRTLPPVTAGGIRNYGWWMAHPTRPVDLARDIAPLADLLGAGRVVVLTGAGMSTDSGIPDYRSPGAPPRSPMTDGEFRGSAAARQRYWARSHVGWTRIGAAAPNPGHRALATLEGLGLVDLLITQNVDGLHGAAGSAAVVDLHGRIDEVVCLSCRQVTSRAQLHARLERLNPGFADLAPVGFLPDGDAELADTSGFRVPGCLRCAGVLMPNLVFFGGSVAKAVVERCYAAVDAARALVVCGSSLTVMSGLRFVRRAHKAGLPVAIVNRGPTRGDELATVRIEAGCSQVLTRLVELLAAPAPSTAGS